MNTTDYKYSAFISYKHNPDEKIASMVQYQIEHYRVPKKWRQASVVEDKRFRKVFRDSTELSGYHDLSEAIQRALISSEYLIVIISKETIDSPWVSREIEFFLKHHDRDHVITVISHVDNPEGFYPEALTENKETGEKIEPISVDYRSLCDDDKNTINRKAKRKIYKDEFPRIAAPMLGVSYDDIKQRLASEKKKRVTISLVAAISLLSIALAYVSWSVIKIKKNYNESLKKQAQIYAKNSRDALNNDDRIEAMELALQALPSDENKDIPVMPEAERALSQAVGAYVVPCEEIEMATDKITMPNGIFDYVTDETGRFILCRDNSGDVMLRDYKTGANLYEGSLSEYGNIKETVYYKDKFYIYSYINEEANILCITKDGEFSLVKSFEETVDINSFNAHLIASKDYLIFIFDVSDDDGWHPLAYLYESANDKWIKHELNANMNDRPEKMIYNEADDSIYFMTVGNIFYRYVIDENRVESYNTKFMTISDIVSDGTVAYITGYKDNGQSFTWDEEVSYYDNRQFNIMAFDLTDNSIKWEDEYKFEYHIMNNEKIYLYKDKSGEYIVSKSANHVRIYDKKTGTLVKSCDYLSGVVNIDCTDKIVVFLGNGSKSELDLNVEEYPVEKIYNTNARSINRYYYENTKLTYVLDEKYDLCIYSNYVGDDSFIQFNLGDIRQPYIIDYETYDNKLVLYCEDKSSEKNYVVLIDTNTFETKWITGVELEKFNRSYKLFVNNTEIILYASEYKALDLYKFDINNGIESSLTINSSANASDDKYFNLDYGDISEKNDNLCFWNIISELESSWDSDNEEEVLNQISKSELCYLNSDCTDLECKKIGDLPAGYNISSVTAYGLSDDLDKLVACVGKDDDKYYILSYSFSNESWNVLDGINGLGYQQVSDVTISMNKDYCAVVNPSQNEILLYDLKTDELIKRINNNGSSVQSIDLSEEGLYVIWFDGKVCKYDLINGELKKSNDIFNLNCNIYKSDWYYSDEFFVLTITDEIGSDDSCIVDKESYIVTDYIDDGFVTYLPDKDALIIQSKNGKIGTFKRHSLEELIEMAEEETKDE